MEDNTYGLFFSAYDFLNSNENRFNVSIWYNSTYKNDSGQAPIALVRVPRSVNLVNTYNLLTCLFLCHADNLYISFWHVWLNSILCVTLYICILYEYLLENELFASTEHWLSCSFMLWLFLYISLYIFMDIEITLYLRKIDWLVSGSPFLSGKPSLLP